MQQKISLAVLIFALLGFSGGSTDQNRTIEYSSEEIYSGMLDFITFQQAINLFMAVSGKWQDDSFIHMLSKHKVYLGSPDYRIHSTQRIRPSPVNFAVIDKLNAESCRFFIEKSDLNRDYDIKKISDTIENLLIEHVNIKQLKIPQALSELLEHHKTLRQRGLSQEQAAFAICYIILKSERTLVR